MKSITIIAVVMGFIFLIGAMLGVQLMNEQLHLSKPTPLVIEDDIVDRESVSEIKLELAEKSNRSNQAQSTNFFSEMGNFVADKGNRMGRAFLSKIVTFVRVILNGEEQE